MGTAAFSASEPPNLLYKRIGISAASRRAKIADNLDATPGCPFLSAGSGSGAEAGRSPPPAEHESAKQRAEQEIYR